MNRGLTISQKFPTLGMLLYVYFIYIYKIIYTYIKLYIHIYSSMLLFVQRGVFLAFLPRLAPCCHAAVMLQRRGLHSHSVPALFRSGLGRQHAAFSSRHLVLPTVIFGSSCECSSRGGDGRRGDAGGTRFNSFQLSGC